MASLSRKMRLYDGVFVFQYWQIISQWQKKCNFGPLFLSLSLGSFIVSVARLGIFLIQIPTTIFEKQNKTFELGKIM